MLSWLLDRDEPVKKLGLLLAGILVGTAFASHYIPTDRIDAKISKERQSVTPGARGPTRIPFLPSAIPVVGHAMFMAYHANRFLDWVTDIFLSRNGAPFTLRLPFQRNVILTATPEHYEHVMKTQYHNFVKGDHIYDLLKDLLGDSILIVEGDEWKFHRRVFVNLFSSRTLREDMAPIIQNHVRVLMRVLIDADMSKNPIDMFNTVGRFTLDAFGEIAFGFSLNTLTMKDQHPFERAFVMAQHIVAARLIVPTWYWKLKRWLNVGSEKQLREALTTVDQFVMKLISKTMDMRNLSANPTLHERPNIVSLVLANKTTDGKPVDPLVVRNIVLMAMIAGRDTAADGLAWLFHLLSLNPRVEEKLRVELLNKLPKLATDAEYVPEMHEVNTLPYLEATICEALRLFSPVGLAQKLCVRDTVFSDGTFVPKGSNIALVYYAMARMPQVWGNNAASFVPERFIEKETGAMQKVASSKFSVFNTGPRVCVGRHLAMMEMKMVVASVVSRFHLNEVPGQHVACSIGLTIGMKNPLMMYVQKGSAVVTTDGGYMVKAA
ncbi:Cytochrome P450 [Plasmopara halstedii]|uniref:Cytochrome P450 n=1 Tax=Plasmopara halstedii TaxID=4781 RepID=A0A0P1B5W7_PLAHL|nr:Cytochrome P450 [Plasmopara halstedii]CEG49598.1 Cytochrome P450 [Plasmopara halstedii]|eukprot:XP_024585967.1 Cytochrome P450 [Plasmopara halstedii]